MFSMFLFCNGVFWKEQGRDKEEIGWRRMTIGRISETNGKRIREKGGTEINVPKGYRR
jgi:hypothetical protein